MRSALILMASLLLTVSMTLPAMNPTTLPDLPKDAATPTMEHDCTTPEGPLGFCFQFPVEQNRIYLTADSFTFSGEVFSKHGLHTLWVAGEKQELRVDEAGDGYKRYRFSQKINPQAHQETVIRLVAWDVKNHVASYQAIFYRENTKSHKLVFGPEATGRIRSDKNVQSQLKQFVAEKKWNPGDELVAHFSYKAIPKGSELMLEPFSGGESISMNSLMDILSKNIPILKKTVLFNLLVEPGNAKRIAAKLNSMPASFDLTTAFITEDETAWLQRQLLTDDSYNQDRLAYGANQYQGIALAASNEYPPYVLPVFKTHETEQAQYVLLDAEDIRSLGIDGARARVSKRCYGLLETSTYTIYILNKKGTKEWAKDKYKQLKSNELTRDALALAEREAEILARKEVDKLVDKNTKDKHLAMLKKEVIMIGGKMAIKELLKEGPYLLNTFERDRKNSRKWYHVVETKEEKRLKLPLNDPGIIMPAQKRIKTQLPDIPSLFDDKYDRVFRLEPEAES